MSDPAVCTPDVRANICNRGCRSALVCSRRTPLEMFAGALSPYLAAVYTVRDVKSARAVVLTSLAMLKGVMDKQFALAHISQDVSTRTRAWSSKAKLTAACPRHFGTAATALYAARFAERCTQTGCRALLSTIYHLEIPKTLQLNRFWLLTIWINKAQNEKTSTGGLPEGNHTGLAKAEADSSRLA